MKNMQELFNNFKDKEDCTYNEFVKLYETLLDECTKMPSLENQAKELRDMYNHEYAIVKRWPLSNGNNQVYDKERKSGFNKIKRILSEIVSK